MTSVAVVTIVSGRAGHLAAQRRGLARSTRRADLHVVVSMGDPTVVDATAVVPRVGDALPLARARNEGARLALEAGADLLIFLDVDCIPSREMIDRYVRHARDGAVLCGPVTYLPEVSDGYPDDLDGWTNPHAARPNPAPGHVEIGTNWDLFWSLSFAVTSATWHTLGGFCEDYTGYGGEDTDVGRVAERSGLDLLWVGGAHAHHQWHPVSSPPIEHLDDIVTNAAIFHGRWGHWPMIGWLNAFRERGEIDWTPEGSSIARRPVGH
ncbi:glycosyltransferase family 2 protein [Rhodococcus sp. BP-316]|uniref:glycosyltransferase family 2 protein n=1 Tax=Rhodococcus sp. BP-316 TaxID=2739445 RepID=UPI001C9B6C99|nr:galactosyltransferase-related protein [Rhodococcus sp. BP-316]MBY6682613.1 glycosyltransferase family 2 protein [Rhodococcus sp. BP-316]